MAIEDQTLPPIAPQPALVLKPQAAGVIQDDMLERAEEARRADRPQYELDSAIELFAPMRDFKREEKPLSPTYMKAMKLIGVDLGQPVKAPNIRESDFARKRLMRGALLAAGLLHRLDRRPSLPTQETPQLTRLFLSQEQWACRS